MTVLAAVNVEALVIFAIVLDHAGDHLLGVQAHDRRRHLSGPRAGRSRARRTAWRSPATTFSAASFLGIAGLIFLYGFDGFLYSSASSSRS